MNKQQLVTALIVLLIAIGVGWYGFQSNTLTSTPASGKAILPNKPYQAIFLSNNQVYFGKVVSRTPTYTTLRDIYYLQVRQSIQAAGQQPSQQIELIKMGNELHKPTDELQINNEHILFIESLQEDGQVVTAIRRFQSGATTTQSETSTPPATTPPAETTPSN